MRIELSKIDTVTKLKNIVREILDLDPKDVRTPAIIKEWMKRKLVLLLDGYDEIKSYDLDVYLKNNFDEF